MSKRRPVFRTKVCGSCGGEFEPSSGNQIFCQECRPSRAKEYKAKYRSLNPQNTEERRKYSNDWYAKNREKVRAKNKHYDSIRDAQRRIDLDLLKSNPCTDCGNKFHPVCMDFDHIPERGVKLFDVGRGLYNKSWEVILEEIAKCELVCSNCHRLRTMNRRIVNGDVA